MENGKWKMENVPHGIKPQGRKTVPVPVPVIVKKSLNPQYHNPVIVNGNVL